MDNIWALPDRKEAASRSCSKFPSVSLLKWAKLVDPWIDLCTEKMADLCCDGEPIGSLSVAVRALALAKIFYQSLTIIFWLSWSQFFLLPLDLFMRLHLYSKQEHCIICKNVLLACDTWISLGACSTQIMLSHQICQKVEHTQWSTGKVFA